MPVVTILAPAAYEIVLGPVADAVAAALELGAGDVVATRVEAGGTVLSGGGASAEPWPVVMVYGSDRGEQRTGAALEAAERALRDAASSAGLAVGGVWTEWFLPGPPS